MKVEICANSLQSALNAERAGADRIELCSELAVGGVTPSYGLLKAVSEQISIPVRVLIRPRSGSFTYSKEEFEIMKSNILLCKSLGFDGVVSGVLHKDCTLDLARTDELRQAGQDLNFTFHRAFDWVPDPFLALDKLQQLGINTLLTSGQQKKAIDGFELLKGLHKKASSTVVMPGSGINLGNAQYFKDSGFPIIHLSAVQMNLALNTNPKVPMNSSQMLSDTEVPISNFEAIKEIVKAVK